MIVPKSFRSSDRDLMEQAVNDAVVSMLSGCSNTSKPSIKLSEADESFTKAEIERIAKRVVDKELDDKVLKAIKKSDDIEKLVLTITSKALAKFFELMFTRRSTWQSQLKSMV